MSRNLARASALAAIAIALFVIFVWPLRDPRLYWQGRLAGWRAVRSGHLAIHGFGLPSQDHVLYADLLAKRYGVQVFNYGCMRDPHESRWQDGFNDVVEAHLERTYHRDVFDECAREAKRLYAARYTNP